MNINMKNLIAITLIVVLGIGYTFAQPYVRASVGYGFAVGQTAEGEDFTQADNGDITEKVNTFSLGGGLPFGIAGGYMFNENIGAELGLGYLLGNKVETTKSDLINSTTTVETYTRQFRINPCLVFTSANEEFNVYGRVGLVIPIVGKTISDGENVTTRDVDMDSVPDNITTTYKVENEGKISLGYSAATGITYSVSDALEIFGEVELISLAVRKDNQETVEYNEVRTLTTGSSVSVTLADIPEALKVTEFETELNKDSNSNTNPNYDLTKATQAITSYTPFNKIGVNIGIKYTFGL